jgi:hypothetical protein
MVSKCVMLDTGVRLAHASSIHWRILRQSSGGVRLVGMEDGEDQDRCHTESHQGDCQGISEGEFARPQQQAASNQTDENADDVLEAEAVQDVGDDVDKKDSGEEAGDVVVPLHSHFPVIASSLVRSGILILDCVALGDLEESRVRFAAVQIGHLGDACSSAGVVIDAEEDELQVG